MEYKGIDYAARKAYHKVHGDNVLIGSYSLEDALLNPEGGFVDDEARCVDEKIFAYVEDEVLMNLTDEEFENYVNEIID